MKIAEIIPKDNHNLYVVAENGSSGVFDVTPYLNSEVFAPLKDRYEFQRLHNGKYFIEWACGADLSADTILARWQLLASHDVEEFDSSFHAILSK